MYTTVAIYCKTLMHKVLFFKHLNSVISSDSISKELENKGKNEERRKKVWTFAVRFFIFWHFSTPEKEVHFKLKRKLFLMKSNIICEARKVESHARKFIISFHCVFFLSFCNKYKLQCEIQNLISKHPSDF